MGSIAIGYSTSGAGPTTVFVAGCGLVPVDLTQPRLLASLTANSSGIAATNIQVPANASGIPVWFQAMDVSSCKLTNLVFQVVL